MRDIMLKVKAKFNNVLATFLAVLMKMIHEENVNDFVKNF